VNLALSIWGHYWFYGNEETRTMTWRQGARRPRPGALGFRACRWERRECPPAPGPRPISPDYGEADNQEKIHHVSQGTAPQGLGGLVTHGTFVPRFRTAFPRQRAYVARLVGRGQWIRTLFPSPLHRQLAGVRLAKKARVWGIVIRRTRTASAKKKHVGSRPGLFLGNIPQGVQIEKHIERQGVGLVPLRLGIPTSGNKFDGVGSWYGS
jgi:hypothetical protein